MYYPNLEVKIFKRGIKQKALADALGISVRSLHNKLKGIVPFTWPEVCVMQTEFFPEATKDELLANDTGQKGA